ncbi:hypothetical protein EDB85DRAFT_2243368 [Lactarius pseudohatsudake]|nr:hypothetical protein EDB85DRAFT_2243368 [Lactarius pseudohatsudake]
MNLDFLDKGSGSDKLPPQMVLVRVLRELEDDFTHYKGIYTELAGQYEVMDTASNIVKRNVSAHKAPTVACCPAAAPSPSLPCRGGCGRRHCRQHRRLLAIVVAVVDGSSPLRRGRGRCRYHIAIAVIAVVVVVVTSSR